MRTALLAKFITVFLLTNIIGLWLANFFLEPGLNQQISESVTLVNDDKNDPLNSVALLAYILVATGALLLVIAFFKKRMNQLFRIIEAIAVFFITASVFELALYALFPNFQVPAIIVLAVGASAVAARNIWPENKTIRNAATILLAAYGGALIGTGLSVFPILIFIILLSAYDFIAVFKTKHMVTIAKAVTQKNLAFSIALPTPEHTFELGTGDLVMPLAFSSAVLQQYSAALSFPNSKAA